MTLKILAIDIGAGTEDVLLYDDSKTIENCIKMVLPSPTLIYAEIIEKLTAKKRNLLIKGDIIGGGAVSVAIKNHLKSALKVTMTEKAALTVRNNLEQVRSMGIDVVKGESDLPKSGGQVISFEEVNLAKITRFLSEIGVETRDIDVVAVAVQDHGAHPSDESNRRYRMSRMEDLLKKNSSIETLAYEDDEVPEFFLRMRSAIEASKRQLPNATPMVMDTSLSAVLGCLEDPVVVKSDRIMAVNVGNGHTLAAIIQNGHVLGLMEHHTRMLRHKPKKLEQLLLDFAKGSVTAKDVFDDGGHGAFYLKDISGNKEGPISGKVDIIAVTGPNRQIVADTGIPIHFAAAAGDVMMTGTMGLIRAVLRKLR